MNQDEPYLEAEAVDTFEFGLARLVDGIASFIADAAQPDTQRNGPLAHRHRDEK